MFNKNVMLRIFVLAVVLSLALSACGEAAVEAPVATEAPVVVATEAPAEEPVVRGKGSGLPCAPNCQYSDLVVGFLQTGSEGGWRAANTASFNETAEQLGLTLKFYDSQNDLAKQVAGFQQFNEDPDVNVIVLSALETTGWEQLIKDAYAAGKIVVIQDRRIDAPADLFETFIGADFVEEGRKAAREICELLKDSDSKNVWELVGNVGSSAAKDRGQGFREAMGECGLVVTKSQTANWSITEGKQVTEAWLKETTDVQAIFGQNDEMALGAIEALKEAGLTPGVDVVVLSVDATAGAFTAMLAGTLNVTVECNPLLAPQVYEAALMAANGEVLPEWVPSQEGVFRSTDANLQEIADGRKY
ncbi:MAG: ABC transporter substrate-binding protein [Anaerolineaceae bacterium]|nr:ABC transporter substrate-binding protein [Anaerolineaceae bacterium]MBN2677850.1 ABC transporter substrate-binding protein [Anaerolineaceae bacterium]